MKPYNFQIFLPSEPIPPHDHLIEINERFEEQSERTVVINEFENAREEDEGK